MSATTIPTPASTPGGAPPVTGLTKKLAAVAAAIPWVEKRGHNSHHNYSFAQAVDVTRQVREQLIAHGITLIPGVTPGSVRHEPAIGGRGALTTVDLTYTFVDNETGASVTVPWAGVGSDVGGDKGLYKAFTGGLKYMLLATFLLPTTNDPEHDGLTQDQPQVGTVGKDADRPAATRIPLDRAKSIADSAVAVGLASWDGEDGALAMDAVLRAKLASIGAPEKLTALDVDQAEAVEAFLAAETAEQGA